jgi:hypothetical protein
MKLSAKFNAISTPSLRSKMKQEKHYLHAAIVLLLNIIGYITAYYLAILLHEWGHGTVAWLYGLKQTPFDIHYGGWLLLHVDEAVNYSKLLANHHSIAAALIGAGGFTVSFILALSSFFLLNLNAIQRRKIAYIFIYWGLAFSLLI